ncbi:MAG: hypothetical protein ACI87W_001596 [Halieaceae bacterium]
MLATSSTRTEQYWIDDKGQESWDADHPMVRLLLIGMMLYNDIDVDPDSIDPTALYLATASGGTDRDPLSPRAQSATHRNWFREPGMRLSLANG